MSLSNRCVRQFDKKDWANGQDYFQRGAVQIVDDDSNFLEAEVQGSGDYFYSVIIDWSHVQWRRTLSVQCTCPRFEDYAICKHVAATLFAAEQQGYGQKIPGTEPLLIEAAGHPSSKPAVTLSPKNAVNSNKKKAKPQPQRPLWKTALEQMAKIPSVTETRSSYRKNGEAQPHEIWYLLGLEETMARGRPYLTLWQRILKRDGSFGKLKPLQLLQKEINSLPARQDRDLLGILAGNDLGNIPRYGGYSDAQFNSLSQVTIAPPMFEFMFPLLANTKKFGYLPTEATPSVENIRPLYWEGEEPWKLSLQVAKTPDGTHWELKGQLERSAVVKPLTEATALLSCGIAIFPDRIARFDPQGDFRWTIMLRQHGNLWFPVNDAQQFLALLAQYPDLPPIDWPQELRCTEETGVPQPCLKITDPKDSWQKLLDCQLTFRYGNEIVSNRFGPAGWYDSASGQKIRRDFQAEQQARDRLLSAGVQSTYYYGNTQAENYSLPPARMPELVNRLASDGWQIWTEGRAIRRPGSMSINLTSGIDWFDLNVKCDFGGPTATLPQILAALQNQEKLIELSDGSQGLLTQDWLTRYFPMLELGEVKGNRVRFVRTQAALLDALLGVQQQAQVTVDTAFERLRDEVRNFSGIQPRLPSTSFKGELRPYQQEGLGWLHFLHQIGFGGCLADDMGLGKTVQILAFLQSFHSPKKRTTNSLPVSDADEQGPRPSLVVVPKSLVFNWLEEAARFTPSLRLFNYSGPDRKQFFSAENDYDLLITTYGTLRRDIAKLKNCRFEYVILDEAQAIKNASSQIAKASRILHSRHRLAVTGTPVENNLDDLWSIFEFLNPGMLGKNQALKKLLASAPHMKISGTDDEAPQPRHDLSLLSRALRPFLLRRTKQQVLTELPEKMEQTVYCELDAPQRKIYEELRLFYRNSLFERIEETSLGKSKFHILEALLRLRQAACHPGLLEKRKASEPSAKLETLLEQLAEVVEGGHKALVFSQFTSFLAIVKDQLDRRGIVYEYLDGKTTKRQTKINRFQTDPACPVFLISLKAGGQGLNLTAANYVFILDPWWNPAVEAQAVDRAHRMGQQQRVNAYRLIAKETLEEKILLLQNQKRDLAESIISADSNLIRKLTVEDLQILLS